MTCNMTTTKSIPTTTQSITPMTCNITTTKSIPITTTTTVNLKVENSLKDTVDNLSYEDPDKILYLRILIGCVIILLLMVLLLLSLK